MTQPNTINMTFDTSLVDLQQPHPSLNTSFSTTESEPSDAGYAQSTAQHPIETPELPPNPDSQPNQDTPKQSLSQTGPAPPKPSTPVHHIPTQEAYDAWASIYDADGNMLQAIDDLELSTLLPEFVAQIPKATPAPTSTLNMIDLGCGTGRNTAKLLTNTVLWPDQDVLESIHITGLDFSRGMLDVAAQKLGALVGTGTGRVTYQLEQCDCFPTVANASASPIPVLQNQNQDQDREEGKILGPVDALVSTLVLEHVPLHDYFATLAALVRPGGCALVTNMHDEMGKMSQAGFVREDGVKVRAGKSFIHSPKETVEEAQRQGFEVLTVREREVRGEDVERGNVGKRGLKWVGVKVWYGVLLRRVG
ncbi:S-adenosyl-L-methionine-dependent methyltransferase [Clohesyomyces aquaticus]|uniref:S-adenosyl-L-methionine-dependent methyltransferase n=1 Tax=Clohesyomyces aquaticus TaxID=1231657 RepID=A0A1Y2AAG3_9PLEO|nr:S-adenosyl-L-methionine-dependent methyltransferase [Clohesyomyces aquaticus]